MASYKDICQVEGYLKINADMLFKNEYMIKIFWEYLYSIPEADVVPRSEVEKLKVELEAMRGAANSYKMHYEQAQAEKDNLIATYEAMMRTYAEQLFEEIEKKIAEEDNIFEKCASMIVGSDYCNGRSEAIGFILGLIAELKKKHLGEKK